MKQRSEVAADRAASYLREMGLQCGTPFQNSIWELTAIHFGQKRENVLACVRREIAHAFRMAPDRFSNERVGDVPARPPQSMAFLRLGLYMINRVVY